MAQIWHRQAAGELLQTKGVAEYWRASKYRIRTEEAGKVWIEADPNATWQLFSPFNSYSENHGPHLDFLRLKSSYREWSSENADKVEEFANQYGLLDLFHDRYSAPILPPPKKYIAPEAVIRKSGKLEGLDPSTEGFALLERLLRQQYDSPYLPLTWTEVALPSEVSFAPKRNRTGGRLDPAGFEPDPETIPWEEARKEFGALFVADTSAATRARVLCTREWADAWYFAIPDFSDEEKEMLASHLNWNLIGVSPYAFLNEGKWERGWRCPSLLQAIRLMLYLNLTGGKDIKKCASQGCLEYFIVNSSNRKRKYCSTRCANRASTRMGRGQEP